MLLKQFILVAFYFICHKIVHEVRIKRRKGSVKRYTHTDRPNCTKCPRHTVKLIANVQNLSLQHNKLL